MKLLSYFPFALCLAAALSLGTPDLMAASKKHSSSSKNNSHHVAKRGSSSSSSSHARSSISHRSSAPKRVASSGSRSHHSSAPKHIASSRSSRSHSSAPKHLASRNSSRSHSSAPKHIASNSRSHSSNSRNVKRPVSHTQLASRSVGHDSNRVIHHSSKGKSDHNRNLASGRSSSSVRHSSSANNRDRDRNVASSRSRSSVHHSSPSSRHLASSSSRHRDRSHYKQRHEHHSAQWYRDNNWGYDHDYYRSHRQHRYYNDSLGIFLIDNTAPYYYYPGYNSYDSGYGYGYSEPAPVYYDRSYYGVDYETRLAVQDALAQAGYYNGPIDGIIGAGTRSAIANYQYDNGLPETGVIDNTLLQSLGL